MCWAEHLGLSDACSSARDCSFAQNLYNIRQRMTTKGIEKYAGKGYEAGGSEEWLLHWCGVVTFRWGSFCCSFGQIGLTVSNSIGDCVNMEERWWWHEWWHKLRAATLWIGILEANAQELLLNPVLTTVVPVPVGQLSPIFVGLRICELPQWLEQTSNMWLGSTVVESEVGCMTWRHMSSVLYFLILFPLFWMS